MTKQGKGLLNNSTLTSEEGGHDVTLWQQLACSDGIHGQESWMQAARFALWSLD